MSTSKRLPVNTASGLLGTLKISSIFVDLTHRKFNQFRYPRLHERLRYGNLMALRCDNVQSLEKNQMAPIDRYCSQGEQIIGYIYSVSDAARGGSCGEPMANQAAIDADIWTGDKDSNPDEFSCSMEIVFPGQR